MLFRLRSSSCGMYSNTLALAACVHSHTLALKFSYACSPSSRFGWQQVISPVVRLGLNRLRARSQFSGLVPTCLPRRALSFACALSLLLQR